MRKKKLEGMGRMFEVVGVFDRIYRMIRIKRKAEVEQVLAMFGGCSGWRSCLTLKTSVQLLRS